ncbi:MAG: hypothetical protein H7138_15905, partial [Myxococcales bacterium]|nr:hypothetical protein [Myxococcales bacterium]
PAGTVPELQFWVKVAGAPNWTILPAYTTGPGSFTPTAPAPSPFAPWRGPIDKSRRPLVEGS